MENTKTQIRVRAPSFKLEVPGNGEYKKMFMHKIKCVKDIMKTKLKKSVTHGGVIEAALDFWLQNHQPATGHVNPHVVLEKTETKQNLYVIAESSLPKFLELTESHSRFCPRTLSIGKVYHRGHVMLCKLSCNASTGKHVYLWASSPKLPDNTFLANARMQHALIFSGMLPCHYMRFSAGAGLGLINPSKRRQFLNHFQKYIHEEYVYSIDDALLHEVANYEINQDSPVSWQGIDIMTDARHGWRKNAKDSSIVAIGDRSHKVIQCVHVTKEEDHVSQRHEKVGTMKFYDYMHSKDVPIAVHAHDRNMSINKLVRDQTPTIVNQNDTWHGVKSLKKAVSAVSCGPKYKHGKTWHRQLRDKVEPVCTHAHWAIRHCEGNATTLRQNLDNVIQHYKNQHDHCHSSARCKRIQKYEPSRVVLTDPVAEMMLKKAICSSSVYKNAEDFSLGKDTYYVESFNNTMNMFQDKRISFGDVQYNVRADLAVCHWNENVDRTYTSIWNPKNPKAPRSKKGKKIYKNCTFQYRDSVWHRYICAQYDA